MKKRGIVLEGGGMRGMYTAGVLDVLMEAGIVFDGAIGVSAGAVFGCNLKSRQIGRTIRYNTRFARNKDYCSMRNLVKKGDLFGTEFCYHKVPFELDPFDVKTFRENPMEFYIVCTDAATGKAVYRKAKDVGPEDMEYFRASASMPGVSRPVKIKGRVFLDGGIADSIPLGAMEKLGYEKNVVVLTQPRDFVKKRPKSLPAMKFVLRKYPNLYKALKTRHIRYNKETDYVKEKEGRGDAFVLAPPEALHISSAERDRREMLRVYYIGREVAEKSLDKLREFMKDGNS